MVFDYHRFAVAYTLNLVIAIYVVGLWTDFHKFNSHLKLFKNSILIQHGSNLFIDKGTEVKQESLNLIFDKANMCP
jgi:hypothetical protein